jgi:hypothetical protein
MVMSAQSSQKRILRDSGLLSKSYALYMLENISVAKNLARLSLDVFPLLQRYNNREGYTGNLSRHALNWAKENFLPFPVTIWRNGKKHIFDYASHPDFPLPVLSSTAAQTC